LVGVLGDESGDGPKGVGAINNIEDSFLTVGSFARARLDGFRDGANGVCDIAVRNGNVGDESMPTIIERVARGSDRVGSRTEQHAFEAVPPRKEEREVAQISGLV
jgi:hypothetical protein